MKYVLLSLPFLASVALASTSCGSGNNCQRAVIGSAAGSTAPESRKSDCSSFFRYTVTPATTTSTVTVTAYATQSSTYTKVVATTVVSTVIATSTTTTEIFSASSSSSRTASAAKRGLNQNSPKNPAPMEKRQATTTTTAEPVTSSPTDIPAYASPCSGSSAYSSACSCLGVSSSYTTVDTPTAYTTTTTHVTTTSISTTSTAATLSTSRTTSTSIAVVSVYYCPPNTIKPGASCGCNYDLKCGYRLTQSISPVVVTLTGVSLAACIADCDNRISCASANYKISTGACIEYSAYTPSSTRFGQGVGDDDNVAVNLVYGQAACNACSSS